MVIAFGGEEAEEVLPAAFWVFEVADGVEVVEAYLFEETLLGGRFVEGEEVRAKDEVEGFPLLQAGALVKGMPCSGMGEDLGFPGAFMHLSASKHTIEGEATILVDWRERVEVQMPTSDAWGISGQSCRCRR